MFDTINSYVYNYFQQINIKRTHQKIKTAKKYCTRNKQMQFKLNIIN